MKFLIAALTLAFSSVISSYAAELPDDTISISLLKTIVRRETLEVAEIYIVAELAGKDMAFYCESGMRNMPQFPDTLDCETRRGDANSGTFKFSVHAPIPQIAEPTDASQLFESEFAPSWASPMILYTEWDTGKFRTFGSVKVPDGALVIESPNDSTFTLSTTDETEPLEPEVTTLPN